MKFLNKIVLAISAIFYALFSFKRELTPFKGNLFANDFSDKGQLEWFYYSIISYLFLIFIGLVGVLEVDKRVKTTFFIALVVGGVISIFQYIVFGYHEPNYITIISNAIPLGIIILPFIYGTNKS